MATIKDVAKEAGLAVGTVSRILNNRGYISDQARLSVEEAMKKLNYHPNETARALKRRWFDMIGLIVPRIDHPYFSLLIQSLTQEANARKKHLLLLNSDGIRDRENEYIELCRRNQVEGIILCNGNLDLDRPKDLDLPVVTIERKSEGGDASIECNNYEGGILAAEHLISCGCDSLLHIQGITGESMPAHQRWKGFQETCRGYQVDCVRIEASLPDYQLSDPEDFFRTHWETIRQARGVFLSDDLLAVEFIRYLRKVGMKIPEDMKVIGFDDIPLASMVTPELTTLRQPVREMGKAAMDMIRRIRNHAEVPERTVFPVELIVRNTTKI